MHRKARRRKDIMNPIHITTRLNGYEIIAAISRMPGTNCGFDDREMVILGHDPSRRTGKYVTALVNGRPDPLDMPVREWYMGHYFEDLLPAQHDWLERAGMKNHFAFGCGDDDCSCPECPNGRENERRADEEVNA